MVVVQGRNYDSVVIKEQAVLVAGLLTLTVDGVSGTVTPLLPGERAIQDIALSNDLGFTTFDVETSIDGGATFRPVFTIRLGVESKTFPFNQIVSTPTSGVVVRVRATPTGAPRVSGALTVPQVK